MAALQASNPASAARYFAVLASPRKDPFVAEPLLSWPSAGRHPAETRKSPPDAGSRALANGPFEHVALFGVIGSAATVAANGDRLRRYQDAFGVETLDQISEPLPRLYGRRRRRASRRRISRSVHRLAAIFSISWTLAFPRSRSVKKLSPRGRLVVAGVRARQQHHFLGDLRGGCPDFLAVHDIAIAVTFRPRLGCESCRARHPAR